MPLWLKAVDISKTAGLNIVWKLCGFNTVMSFLDAIGNRICVSALEDMDLKQLLVLCLVKL